jgi:phosphoglycerol geranylgeranyltransferase
MYAAICRRRDEGQGQLAVLIDPDKAEAAHLDKLFQSAHQRYVDLYLIGGSELRSGDLELTVQAVRKRTNKPIVLFPGDPGQISPQADALLLLALLSGRNPEYLIGKQVEAAFALKESGLELIPTAYLLLGDEQKSAVARVTQTAPIPLSFREKILSTALSGQQLGFKMLYLESGSGAKHTIESTLVQEVSRLVDLPILVGGGIQHFDQVRELWDAGADVVVVGTALERSPETFFPI